MSKTLTLTFPLERFDCVCPKCLTKFISLLKESDNTITCPTCRLTHKNYGIKEFLKEPEVLAVFTYKQYDIRFIRFRKSFYFNSKLQIYNTNTGKLMEIELNFLGDKTRYSHCPFTNALMLLDHQLSDEEILELQSLFEKHGLLKPAVNLVKKSTTIIPSVTLKKDRIVFKIGKKERHIPLEEIDSFLEQSDEKLIALFKKHFEVNVEPEAIRNAVKKLILPEEKDTVAFNNFIVKLHPEEKGWLVQLFKKDKADNIIPLTSAKIYVERFEKIFGSYKFSLWRKAFKKKYKKKWQEKLDELIAELQHYIEEYKPELEEAEQFQDLTPYLMTPLLTEEEMKKYQPYAEKWLRSPKLIGHIKDTLDERITKESANELAIFFAGHSSLLGIINSKDVINTLGRGPSQSGKSTISKNVLRLFPNVIDFTGVTEQAFHWAKADFRGKNIFIRELSGAKTASPSLRMIATEEGLRLFSPQKDNKGKIRSKVIESIGTPGVHSTTAAVEVEEQLENRTVFVSADESKEQTKKVISEKAERHKKPYVAKFSDNEMIIRCMNQLRPPIRVLIPFADKISEQFPKDSLRCRADYDRFCALVKCIASYYRDQRLRLLWQKPKQIIEFKETIILANLTDSYYALVIASEVFAPTIHSLPAYLINFYHQIPHGIDFKLDDVIKATGKAKGTCRKYLTHLYRKGLVFGKKDEGGHWSYYTGAKIQLHDFINMVKTVTFTKLEFKEYLKDYFKYVPDETKLDSLYKMWRGNENSRYDLQTEIEKEKITQKKL